jgi:DMSO/TMAO reductase YedYZ molybdopterin-dependent catalytic subunit
MTSVPTAAGPAFEPQELALAVRNHAMPQEALRYDVTPAGLHYLLIHYDIPAVDPAAFRLTIGGHVRRPLTLTIDDLRARPAVTAAVTLECAGNGRALLEPRPISQPWLRGAVGNAEWTGTPLAPLLAEAEPASGAVEVSFAGLDHGLEGGVEQDYERGLSIDEAMRPDALLAYAMNGAPLLPQHGFPLRLVIPGWYGMAHVKWLTRISVLDEPFEGYQNLVSYRRQTDEDDVPGAPVQRIRVRSLIEPPGFTSFSPRARILDPGPVRLRGRAWSGSAPVTRVDVSTDGGASWSEADLAPAGDPYAWRAWQTQWDATPGEHVLCSRATDATGATQPEEPEWNVGGFENNAIERMPVTVRAR